MLTGRRGRRAASTGASAPALPQSPAQHRRETEHSGTEGGCRTSSCRANADSCCTAAPPLSSAEGSRMRAGSQDPVWNTSGAPSGEMRPHLPVPGDPYPTADEEEGALQLQVTRPQGEREARDNPAVSPEPPPWSHPSEHCRGLVASRHWQRGRRW